MSREERVYSDIAVHPGEFLAEELEARGISQKDLALRTGRPEQTISAIINGKKSITHDTALELEKVLGIGASFWVNLEASYQLTKARLRERHDLEKSEDWLGTFPVKEMRNRGHLPATNDPGELLDGLLRFFGVASFEALRAREQTILGFRVTPGSKVDEGALWAWLREGERDAERIETKPFDSAGFGSALQSIRRHTTEPPDESFPAIRDLCAQVGVAFVVTRQYPKSGANGVARWLTPTKAMIQLSTHRRWADVFWFSLFHESHHVLQGSRKTAFVNGIRTDESPEEEAADAFAADTLIPREEWARFVDTSIDHSTVIRFAERLGIAPGIVVGRLQHERIIGFNRMNDLRERFVWSDRPAT